MDKQEINDLAKQLRISYFGGIEPEPWDHLTNADQQRWIYVVEEAYRWLVG